MRRASAHHRTPSTVLAGLLATLSLLAGCGSEAPVEPVDPVVLIGIDGVAPDILADLIDAGRLPNFERFASEGSLGRIGTFAPTFSPVIWTTIATGQDAAAHGITDFLDDKKRPYTSNARRVPAVWNLASDGGRTVDCVGWWITWPAERVDGRLVASYAAQAQAKIIWKPTIWESLKKQTWPPDLQTEIRPLLTLANDEQELYPHMRRAYPIPDELDANAGRIINDLAWTFAADLSVAAIAGHMLETGPADLTLAYLASPDVAGHRFWRYHQPSDVGYEVTPAEVLAYGDFINRAYVEADRMLGELLAKLPADATILIVSDHGMHVDPLNRYNSTALASGAHEDAPAGVFGVLGPRAAALGNRLRPESGAALGDVFQVAPMLMHLLDLPVPGHWRGVRGDVIELERTLVESWRAEHPIVRGSNPDADFRAATPSMLPTEGANRMFTDAFVGIGYLGDLESDEEPEPAPYAGDGAGTEDATQ